jgi:hypothetical protein
MLSREDIRALEGVAPRVPRKVMLALQGRPSMRSKEFLHAFRGRSCTRSKHQGEREEEAINL